jgi:hypothetical protein
MTSYRSDQSRAGSDSPFDQIRAELDSLCATALGRDRRLYRIDSDFNIHLIVSQSLKRSGPAETM